MLNVEIVTPERIVHQVTGTEVLLPTVDGQIGIRKGHLPLITVLKAGQIVVKQDGGEELYAVAGGMVEVINDHIRILADSAERAEELSELQVHAAVERARNLKLEAGSQHEFDDASANLEAQLARLKVVNRKKARGKVSFDQ